MGSHAIKVAALGSTRGSSLQPVIEAIEAGQLNAEIVAVVSNRKKSGILERARTHGLPHFFISAKGKEREKFDAEVTELLEARETELVLCIGYMRFLSADFVQKWYGKVANVHPSLLPKHPGLMDLDVHQAVVDAEDAETGCTVHLIDEGVDSGPILIQKRIPVEKQDTADSLKEKVQPLEGIAFIELIDRWPVTGIPQDQVNNEN